MTGASILRRMAGGCAAVLALGAGLSANAAVARERFVATAVNIATPGPTGSGRVEIVIDRYSTDAERDRLSNALLEKGPEKLLDTLQDLPRVGYIRTPNSIGYDLRYAPEDAARRGGRADRHHNRPLHRLLGVGEPAADNRLSLHCDRNADRAGRRRRRQDDAPDEDPLRQQHETHRARELRVAAGHAHDGPARVEVARRVCRFALLRAHSLQHDDGLIIHRLHTAAKAAQG